MKYFRHKILAIISLFICAIMSVLFFACAPNTSDSTAGSNGNITDNRQEEVNNAPDLEEENSNKEEEPSQPELPNEEQEQIQPELPNEQENTAPTAKFADAGDSYSAVVKPIYEAVQEILQDQIDNHGLVLVNGTANPRITNIRYFYGRSLTIFYRTDIHISLNGPISEILEQEYGINFENFGIDQSESYKAYLKFYNTELSLQTSSKEVYEETLLPLAEHSAELILKDYYENLDEITVSISNFGKRIILRENSIFSEIHHKIADALNVGLAERNYPLITNQDIEISFGGNLNFPNVYNALHIDVTINNIDYTFIMSFNIEGKYSEDFIGYYKGEPKSGYTTVNPDLLVPKNEEYFDFFEQLKIEEMDFTNLEKTFKAYNDPAVESKALYEPCGDKTWLYF